MNDASIIEVNQLMLSAPFHSTNARTNETLERPSG
jgi:hypothetical protein